MDNNFAIKVENLSKRYRIGLKEKRHDTFGGAVASWLKSPFTNWKQLRKLSRFNENDGEDIIWAIKDVSFEVKEGEVVGIIGPNGAGKSTLLKIISRITEPTSGEVIFNGRVSSLLEVGTGFHSELTGRENIYLNGTILGMTKNEIDRKFDEIVSFSGIEKFIDTPVKRYSSGMNVRLAFSVAAHLDPEILLIDEVLAVGDAKFQKKCLGKMNEVANMGRTVLFVSHNMGAIRSLCCRGILLNNGLKNFDGQINDCIEKYFESLFDNSNIQNLSEEELKIKKVNLKNARNEITNNFQPGDDLIIEILYHAPEKIEKPHFWVSVNGATGSLFAANMIFDDTAPDYIEGDGTIRCVFKSIPLLPQEYFIRMGVRDSSTVNFLTQTRDVEALNVICMMKDIGFRGELADSLAGFSAPILIPYEWHLPDGKIFSYQINKDQR